MPKTSNSISVFSSHVCVKWMLNKTLWHCVWCFSKNLPLKSCKHAFCCSQLPANTHLALPFCAEEICCWSWPQNDEWVDWQPWVVVVRGTRMLWPLALFAVVLKKKEQHELSPMPTCEPIQLEKKNGRASRDPNRSKPKPACKNTYSTALSCKVQVYRCQHERPSQGWQGWATWTLWPPWIKTASCDSWTSAWSRNNWIKVNPM